MRGIASIAPRLAATLLVTALVAACATKPPPPPSVSRERITLLPGADGKVGTVVVHAADREVTLNTAYATAEVQKLVPPAGTGTTVVTLQSFSDADSETRKRLEPALAALPPAPHRYTVFFLFDQAQLTPESMKLIDDIKRDLATLPVPEVVVTGHTDLVGSDAYNDALSGRRAEIVRTILVNAGVSIARIDVAARGKRDPLVPTRDGVSEPRNRRVEIKVR